MARVQFGATVTGLSGTVNGITFSRNAAGAYAKPWARPPLSRTASQSASRSRLSDAAQAWAGLSSGEKAAWDAFALAPNEDDYDPWGDPRFLSGFQWFTRACARRALVGLDPDVAVPTGAALAAPTGFSLTIETPGSGASTVAWDSAEFDTGESAILFLAPTTSIAAADVWRGWALVLALQDPGDTGETITDEVLAAFGNLQPGWSVYGRLFNQAELGNRSTPAVTSTVIVAP